MRRPSVSSSRNGVKLLVDPISARYLRGAEVDFVDNVTGGGFTIKNPEREVDLRLRLVLQRLETVQVVRR